MHGPDALALLERACANRIDRAPGAVVYTQMLDRRGGVVADITVTRLADDRFRVVTGAGVVDADHGWLRMVADDAGLARVAIDDRTDELAVIGSGGRRRAPCSRRRRATTSRTRRSRSTGARGARDQPRDRARAADHLRRRARLQLLAQREDAVQVGSALGGRPRARDRADRLPRRRRPADGEGLPLHRRRPDAVQDIAARAGLEGCIDWAREGFVGRDAVLRAREAGLERRLRTLRIGDGGWLAVHGGEAVRLDGAVVSRLRSAAYGFTAGCVVAYASLPVDLPEGAEVEIDVLGERVRGAVGPDVLHDPQNLRLRG